MFDSCVVHHGIISGVIVTVFDSCVVHHGIISGVIVTVTLVWYIMGSLVV